MSKEEKISSKNAKINKIFTYLRPAKKNEINQVHIWLMRAIEESPFYNDLFKQFEKSRLSKNYLLNLHYTNPAHIMLMLDNDKPCGFMISGPELGTLWLYWSYLLPAHRKGMLAMNAMRSFIEYWDNGDFHKISTYTKEGNKPAEIIMKRNGYEHIVTLEKHIFGEDYQLYERKLNKKSKIYDFGLKTGRLSLLKQRIKRLFAI